MAKLLFVPALAVLLSALSAAANDTESRVELRVIHPPSRTVMDPAEPALLTGETRVTLGAGQGLDAVVAIDVSKSTGAFVGADIDGDGFEERGQAGGDDSVIAAEIVAAERVIDELVRDGHRVALVRFSGRSPEWWLTHPAAEILQPLTGDRATLRRALEAFREPPRGMTDIAAALQESLAALEGGGKGRERILLLFTDGSPTQPHQEPAQNLQAALEAAARCADAGVRVHTFAIGVGALANPVGLIQIADRTGGLFTPVESLSDLSDIAGWVARASIRDVRVRNLTTDELAQRMRMGSDGSWSALVRVREGRNRIEVTVSVAGAGRARQELILIGRAGAGPQEVPESLAQHRRMLLEDRLARLQQKILELAEALRQRLVDEMTEVRTRKELELGVESEAPGAAHR
jgi:hypothetical protein